MKRFLLVLLTLLLSACAVGEAVPPGDYIAYPKDRRTMIAPITITAEGYHIDVANRATAAPKTPVPTSGAILTATPYPTYTPLPTYTLYPTYSPVTGGASEDDPTPTIDTEPQPTPEPGEEKVCLVRNLSGGPYNIRADHVATATIVGQVPTSEYATVVSVYVISDVTNEWFRVTYGNVTGWMIRNDDDLLFGASDTLDICLDTDLTPTEYANNPLPTPAPTLTGPTPTTLPPIPVGCTVINGKTSNLNTRSGPGLNYPIVGKLAPGDTGQAIQTYSNGEEVWVNFARLSAGGQSTYAWVAIFVPTQGNLASLTGPCDGLAEMVAIRVGWHLTQGARWEPLASTATDYSAVKSTDLTKDVAATFTTVNPGALWVHRSIFGSGGAFNCPTFEWYSPAVWVDRYVATWPTDAQYVETINECQTGPGGDAFNNFVIESTKYANSLGFCVLVFSFASGTPDYPEWITLVPILRWLDQNPCRYENGRPIYNGIALHGAFCSGDGMMSTEFTRELHICDRHVFIRDVLLANTGYDLLDFKGPIVGSEWGIDAGYGGTSADPTWGTADWLEVVAYTLDLYEKEGIIDALILWNIGDGGAGQWIDRWYWIDPLAKLLRSRALLQ